MDDMPLYGEESMGKKVLTWVVVVVLAVWGLFCVAIGIAFGIIANFTNILLAASMIIAAVSAIMLFRWYRAEDLDPKFRILLLLLVIQTLLVGISINVNIWPNRDPLSKADKCIDGAWSTFGSNKPIYVSSLSSFGTQQPNAPPPGCYAQCRAGTGFDFSNVGLGCRAFVNNTK